jgi:hypothetical protein
MGTRIRKYNIDILRTDSWEELRTCFIDKQMEHIDDQATLLVTAGIANSAKVDEELNEIKYKMANMAEKTGKLEDALVSIMAFMAGTLQQPPAPLSMEQQFAAFVAAQQRKEAPKEKSAIDKAVAHALGELNNKGGGGGGGSGGNSGTKRTR